MEAFPTVSTHGVTAQYDPVVSPPDRESGAEPPARGSVGSLEVREAEARILNALRCDGRPLTLMQLRVRTGVPFLEVQQVTSKLCSSRSIRRLNTIIEAFCLAGLD